MKKVHIIMPCYNQAAYLGDALSSLVAQSYDDISVHISDDGSTDQTRRVISEFIPKIKSRGYSYTITHHQSNQGVFDNFTYLINNIPDDADLIQIWEGDDYLKPTSIADRVDALISNGWDAIHSDTDYVYVDGSMYCTDFWQTHSGYAIESPMTLNQLIQNNRIMTISLLTKKQAFVKACNFQFFKKCSVSLCDYAAFLRLVHIGCRIGYLPKSTAYYRLVPTSLTHSMSRDQILQETYKVQDLARSGCLYKDDVE